MRAQAMRLLTTVVLLSLMGCTSYRSYRQGQVASELGNWDEAVAYYMEALNQDPANIQYRAALLRAKIEASQAHFKKAKEFKEAEVFERAMIELQQAVHLDPTNQYAEAELRNVRETIAAQRENRPLPGTIEELKERTKGILPQPPMLNPRSDEPISLNFLEPVSIFQIYRALGKAFGINVLFDQNLKDQDIPIELHEVTAKTALETLMRAAGHFYKVMDEHTILVAADTPQNRRKYEDLVIQNFPLSNLEVKDMLTILRSLIDAKKIATNEQLNSIILRDTADKVKIAERIINANDKAKAEVVVDVELLQIDSGKLRDLGVELDPFAITQSLNLGGEGNVLRLSDVEFLNQSNWILTIPDFIYTFVKQNTSAQLLAKPRLRITEGEKARLVIGDRVPIPVTTFNSANTIGGNVVPITSFQYQEVGIQIDIEPRVHHNKEITLKVKVEVSNISGFVQGSGGQEQPRIGTRTIDTTIRLKDGETNLLAGLIRNEETESQNGIPGLSEIPLLGRLFSKKRNSADSTDIVLTLTPHIIRNAEISQEDLLPIWVGTEANLTFRGDSPRVESDIDGPFDSGTATPEEIQELMRRRIQRLPRGLRPDQDNGDAEREEELPPSGFDLVPRSGDSIFGEPKDEDEDAPPGATLSRLGLPFVKPAPAAPALGYAGAPQIALAARSSPSPFEDPEGDDAPVRMWMTPQRQLVAAGDLFEVRLEAAARRPVSHLPATLAFDPRVLAIERVEAGGFLGAEGKAEVLSDASTPGRLILGASRLGRIEGVTGTGLVARITFRALAEGSTSLSFLRGKAMNRHLEPIGPLSTDIAVIEVGPAETGGGGPPPGVLPDRPLMVNGPEI